MVNPTLYDAYWLRQLDNMHEAGGRMADIATEIEAGLAQCLRALITGGLTVPTAPGDPRVDALRAAIARFVITSA